MYRGSTVGLPHFARSDRDVQRGTDRVSRYEVFSSSGGSPCCCYKSGVLQQSKPFFGEILSAFPRRLGTLVKIFRGNHAQLFRFDSRLCKLQWRGRSDRCLLPSERPAELTVPSLFFLLLLLLEFKRHRESVAERRDGDMLWRMTASVV